MHIQWKSWTLFYVVILSLYYIAIIYVKWHVEVEHFRLKSCFISNYLTEVEHFCMKSPNLLTGIEHLYSDSQIMWSSDPSDPWIKVTLCIVDIGDEELKIVMTRFWWCWWDDNYEDVMTMLWRWHDDGMLWRWHVMMMTFWLWRYDDIMIMTLWWRYYVMMM